MTDRLQYPSILKNNRNYILYSEIDTITGFINPTLQKDILKLNNSVVFVGDSFLKNIESFNKHTVNIQLMEGSIFACIIQSSDKDSVTYSDLVGQDWNTISRNRISDITLTENAPQNMRVKTTSRNTVTRNNYSYNSESAGDYLVQAGNNYLLGVGLVVGGGVATVLGTTNSDNEYLVYVGAGMALSGFVCTIIAHTKLIKAGKALNQNKSISLHPSTSGLGLALKF